MKAGEERARSEGSWDGWKAPVAGRRRRTRTGTIVATVPFHPARCHPTRVLARGRKRHEIPMKIAKIEDLHCDAGWRKFSFLKVTTDDGLAGWSEFTEGCHPHHRASADRVRSAAGAGNRLNALWPPSTGDDRRQPARRADIENVLWAIKGKALGIPVYELLGGPIRARLPANGRIAAPIGCATISMSASRERTAMTTSRRWAPR
jgi:L-alanine-DL-glutamate epimerase-like enolase superfamily enzyme